MKLTYLLLLSVAAPASLFASAKEAAHHEANIKSALHQAVNKEMTKKSAEHVAPPAIGHVTSLAADHATAPAEHTTTPPAADAAHHQDTAAPHEEHKKKKQHQRKAYPKLDNDDDEMNEMVGCEPHKFMFIAYEDADCSHKSSE